jgi:N6-adenosine-specific RNA methylase IME4
MTFAPLPSGPFDLILADPAWQTLLWSGATRTPTQMDGEDHYATLSLAELAALPVEEIAAPDAVLAMWVIGSHLDQALDLGRAWGFSFTTDLLCWIKQRRLRPDQVDLFTDDIAEPPIGMGKYTRKQVEHCLLFKRGKGLPVRDHAQRQLILSPKREHSRKPEEQYTRLEALFGPTPTRLELFSRTPRTGWTSWGNEVGKFEETV